MRLIPENIKYILLSFLILLLTETAIIAREKADSLNKIPRFFIGITGGPSMNTVDSKGTLSLTDMITDKMKNNYSGSFEFELGYFFARSMGISTGVGYNAYNTDLSLVAYTNKFNTKDSEGEAYERRVSGSNIKEQQNVTFLNVPLCLNFRIPAGAAFGLFLKGGVNFSFPLKHEYNSSGTFNYSGYYPAYNVLLHDLPAYGFPGNSAISTSGDLELKPYNIEGIVLAGFQLTIKRKLQFIVGASYSQSLSTISNYGSSDQFQLSTDSDKLNSMMGGCKSSVAGSVGLRLSIRYYLK